MIAAAPGLMIYKPTLLLCGCAAFAGAAYVPAATTRASAAVSKSASRAGLVVADAEFDPSLMLGPGQKFGPEKPAHPAEK